MTEIKQVTIHKADLKKMRVTAGISQVEMSTILKMSRVQYIRIENGLFKMDYKTWENFKKSINNKVNWRDYFTKNI